MQNGQQIRGDEKSEQYAKKMDTVIYVYLYGDKESEQVVAENPPFNINE